MTKDAILHTAEVIARRHRYKEFYTLGEVAQMIGCGIDGIAGKLARAGITVKKIGNRKLVTAYDIAQYIYSGRISPTDRTSRPT